jgi:tripartite-type tricarboxylate transporter receptor subunit TctC
VRFIVPYTPGGVADLSARFIGNKLADAWGQQVLVDNRPGGNTIIGSEALVKSPADGYTIFLTTIAHTIIPSLMPTPYDAVKDFAAVSTIASNEIVLVASPGVAAGNLKELIALAKSKPGQLNYGSAGTGTINHLAGELFAVAAGIKLQHVSYKGIQPAMSDVMSGRVEMSFASPIYVFPLLKGGKLKALAISGSNRLAGMPDVPTFAEGGLPGVDVKNWVGIAAPAATPKAVIDKISADVAKILALPDVREFLVKQGLDPFISTPEQAAALIRNDIARFANIIKSANIKVEN